MKQETEGCQNGSSQTTKVGMEVGQKNNHHTFTNFRGHEFILITNKPTKESRLTLRIQCGSVDDRRVDCKSRKFSTVCWMFLRQCESFSVDLVDPQLNDNVLELLNLSPVRKFWRKKFLQAGV